MSNDTFERRRASDPQGVIDDLITQTSRQAKAIGEQQKMIEKLNAEVEELKNPGKKTKKKGSHDGEPIGV